MKPVIIGCRTLDFTPEQLAVLKKHQPFAMTMFAEPFKAGPDVARHVIKQFREACPQGKVFIDAEGGRVNRMKPEFGFGWRAIPQARDFANLAKQDLAKACEAIYLNAQLIAYDLVQFGIDGNYAPVVDLVSEEVINKVGEDGKPHATSASLFNRSFGDDPEIVAACGKAFADGLHSMGVVAVLKHAPGYGRVTADPHYGLDKIRVTLDEMMKTDLIPYIRLKNYPAIMTAHTVYELIDPRPATLSPVMMSVIRDTVGFKGVIMADTIEMNSIYPEGFSKTEKDQFGMGLPLPGTLKLITERVLEAGCDLVMHSDCSRNFQDTVDVLEAAPELSADKANWLVKTMTVTRTVKDFDYQAGLQKLQELMII